MLAPAPTALRTEWRPLAALGEVAADWRDLCRRAAEPNVFYEPAFALAAAPVLGRDTGAVLAWSQDGRLVGLFPLRIERHRYGAPPRVLAGWTHAYGPLGTPLVDRDHVAGVIAAFLDHVAGDARLPKLLLLAFLAEDGPVAAALDAEIARRDLRQTSFDRHQRALLKTTSDADSYLAAALGKKRRHELQRQRRRLAEGASLTCEIEGAPDRVAAILADFLALEAGGWKGRAGTAAAQKPDIARLMSAAVTGLAAEGKSLAACLRRDGRAIAATIVIRSGAGAWGWKIAYDESLARFSPGVQVLIDVTERLIGERDIAWSDSCATPGHSMIDHVWRERLAVADRLIAVTPGAAFASACTLETLRRGAITLAKRLRDRLAMIRARAR